MMKKKNGITLIALIITIIVLLILAGVTINMVLGDNGLINKSKNAVGSYKNEQTKENTTLEEFENELNKYMGGSSGTPITSLINATNAADHIGEYIDLGTNLINKTGTTHKADWRIFDADETGVYAILADYLPNDIPGMPNRIVANENRWKIGLNVSNNEEAINLLTTADNWNYFVTNTSPLRGKILGEPTYQQFAKSWNKVNSSVQTIDIITPSTYSSLTDSTGMYIITGTDRTMGYWLSTSYDNSNMCYIYNTGMVGGASIDLDLSLSGGSMGLRPLAHLTSEIKVTGQDANGVWHIAQ